MGLFKTTFLNRLIFKYKVSVDFIDFMKYDFYCNLGYVFSSFEIVIIIIIIIIVIIIIIIIIIMYLLEEPI